MKVSVTIPITRAGQARDLVLTVDDDGNAEAYLPPAERTASAVFTFDPDELLRAAFHMVQARQKDGLPVAPGFTIPPIYEAPALADTEIPGQMDLDDMKEDPDAA